MYFSNTYSIFLDRTEKSLYIRKMKYISSTIKTVDQVTEAMASVVNSKGFGLLHVHDLKATMASKGVEFGPEVRVFEVCNPFKAQGVLTEDIHLNMALPCRISVWEEGGEVKIGTLLPTKFLGMLNSSPGLQAPAKEVEDVLVAIMNEVAV